MRAEASLRRAGGSGEPVVSVSVTTYNHAPYIAQAVEGVLMQEADFPVELVVGDDRSTDGTREILLDLAERHPGRIRLVLPERNLGRNGVPLFLRTLEGLRGRYVAALDGDDYWTEPTKLARQVAFLDAHPECSMCFHDALETADEAARAPRRMNARWPTGVFEPVDVLVHHAVPACAPMYRREVLCPPPDWFADLRIGDLPLYVLAAERGRFGYLNEAMAVYRLHGAGVWTRLDAAARDRLHGDVLARIDRGTAGRHAALLRRVARARWHRYAVASCRAADPRAAAYFAWRLLRAPADDGLSVLPLLGELGRTYARRVARLTARRVTDGVRHAPR